MYKIKRVQAEEVPDAKKLLDLAIDETYGSFVSRKILERVKNHFHSIEVLEAYARDSSSLFIKAADDNGNTLGVAVAIEKENGVLWLSRIYVHPKYQRQGIGAKLLEAVLQGFPDVKRIQLEVGEMSLKGRAFYEKHGFKEIKFIDDPLDAKWKLITMERSVDS